jgi:hypothetical protein
MQRPPLAQGGIHGAAGGKEKPKSDSVTASEAKKGNDESIAVRRERAENQTQCAAVLSQALAAFSEFRNIATASHRGSPAPSTINVDQALGKAKHEERRRQAIERKGGHSELATDFSRE